MKLGFLIFVVAVVIGNACTETTVVNVPASTGPVEQAYCSTTASFGDSLTLTGTVQFNVRKYDPTAHANTGCLGTEQLGGPVKYAEIQVLDENNTIIQCGLTDSTGHLSAVGGGALLVPRNHAALKVLVNSRGQSAHVNASVLDAPTTNGYYSLVASVSTVTAASTVSAGTMTASAKNDIGGGAFNILWNILRANEALRAHVCDSTMNGGSGAETNVNARCAAFDVAPKVTAYWKPGVNPHIYFGGNSSSGLSFYVPGTDKLYILGGVNGDTDNSDTDHFDDSVISHEYGHFIEDHYAKTDSPGGSHDGSHVLDARLMWGEGWADFFSSMVRADKMYRDTFGNIDGTTCGHYFNYDVDLNSNDGTPLDLPQNPDEGNFREFTITRALWDLIDPLPDPQNGGATVGVNGAPLNDDNTTDTSTAPFATLWNVFHSKFPVSTFHFRNVGLFLMNDTDAGSNNTSSAVSFQKIRSDNGDYAKPLPTTTSGGCAGTSLAIAANDPPNCIMGGQLVCTRGNLHACCSHQLLSNNFYDVTADGTINSISLVRTAGNAQLDLYLYKEAYVFGDPNTIVTSDIRTLAASNPTLASGKTIPLTGLAAGHYMLNVNVYTGGGNPAPSNYQLFVNGNQVCP